MVVWSSMALFAGILTVGADHLQIESRLAHLESRIGAMVDAPAGHSTIADRRADELRTLIFDVLDDADARLSLLSGGTAGYEGGFVVNSADGNFRLKLGGYTQARYVFNHQNDAMPGITTDPNRSGFDIRRVRLTLRGHVVDPGWTYKVQLAFSRSTGAMALSDAYIERDLGDGWSLRAGQFKVPLLREERVSATRQLAVDRSLVNALFTANRTQGIMARYRDARHSFELTFNDGANAANGAALIADTEFAVSGRYERLISGSWRQFRDFTSWEGDDPGWLIGVAGHVQRGESGSTTPDEVESLTLTADVSGEFAGVNVFAGGVYRRLDDDAMIAADQYGLVVQAGTFITDEVEVFGRYEWADPDLAGLTGLAAADDVNVITVGINRFINKHRVKWSTDIGYAFDRIDTPSASLGYRSDTGGDHGQTVVRTQLQLVF